MKTVSLSELKNISFYITDITIQKLEPRYIVKNYTYKDVPVSHFTFGTSGYARYFSDDVNIEVLPGTLCYIPKGTTINFEEDEHYTYYKLYFNIYDAITGEDIILNDYSCLFFNEVPKDFSNFIKEFALFFSINNSSSALKFHSLCLDFLHQVDSLINASDKSAVDSIISKAVMYMNANYARDFTTKDLANMCNLSEPYFRALFKKQMTMTPTEYKNHLRIRRACNILLDCNFTVMHISDLVGFNNLQYFCKTFKSITGYSPSKYRQGKNNSHNRKNPNFAEIEINSPVDK